MFKSYNWLSVPIISVKCILIFYCNTNKWTTHAQIHVAINQCHLSYVGIGLNVQEELYFGNYKDATHGNSNYLLTYGNGKSAARIQDHLRPNGAHRWHNYMKSPKHVNFVLFFYNFFFLVALLGRGEGRWVKPVTWGLGMGGRCQLSYKPIGIDSVTFQKFNVHVFHRQCFKGLCMCTLRLTIDMLVLVKVQYNM